MIEFTIQFIDEMMYVKPSYFEIYDYLMISILETGAITLTDGSECVIINEDQISTLKDILENYINPVNYKTDVIKSQIQKQLV